MMTFVIDTNAKHGKDEEDAKEDGAHGHACVDCDDCRDGSCEKPQGLRFFGPYGLDFCENPSLSLRQTPASRKNLRHRNAPFLRAALLDQHRTPGPRVETGNLETLGEPRSERAQL